MIDRSQASHDIKKLDKFLTKCNMVFEDPYIQENPTHNDAITARMSITVVEEYFRQLGFLNVKSKWIREVIDNAEGEDWSRVSRYIKDANNEYMGINRAYEDSVRRGNDAYSKLSSQQDDLHHSTRMKTRLSKKDEPLSQLADEKKRKMSPKTVQYIRSPNYDETGFGDPTEIIARANSGLPETADVPIKSHRSQYQPMDDELRSQLRLPLDTMDDQERVTLIPPEGFLTDRLIQREDKQRHVERMSKAVHDNNPHIADLSDVNRPSNIADRFSSLYDDQWTDAYEDLRKQYEPVISNGGKQGILDLVVILKAAFEFTNKHVESQTERMAHQNREMMLDPCSDRKQENESDPFRHDMVLRRYAKKLIKDTADLSISALQQNFFSHAFPKKLGRISMYSSVKNFADKCIELTWFMNVHDPPMVLIWPDSVSNERMTDYFRFFTVTGTVLDHEVWPALALHKDGPLVIKGVAQFK